ncbi:MAG: hypothetical protein Kapaf2KO_04440 [Candidatus Kapaibacteriales bacterium]
MISCEESVVEPESATKITSSELWTDPNLAYFPSSYDGAELDPVLLDSIRANYDENRHDFVMFIKANCSCRENTELLPKIKKTLDSAGVKDDNISYYLISKAEHSHPYESEVSLNTIPAVFTRTNSQFTYSIVDSSNNDTEKLIENWVFESLK